jgi:hypothetical protein
MQSDDDKQIEWIFIVIGQNFLSSVMNTRGPSQEVLSLLVTCRAERENISFFERKQVSHPKLLQRETVARIIDE